MLRPVRQSSAEPLPLVPAHLPGELIRRPWIHVVDDHRSPASEILMPAALDRAA